MQCWADKHLNLNKTSHKITKQQILAIDHSYPMFEEDKM